MGRLPYSELALLRKKIAVNYEKQELKIINNAIIILLPYPYVNNDTNKKKAKQQNFSTLLSGTAYNAFVRRAPNM